MGYDGILERRGGSEPWCFVHAADLHLDTPFQGLHSTAPDVARRLADASLEAFDNVVSLAVERRARFVVLAGDIYDGPVRGLRAQIRFRRGLERLSEEGISAFVAHGNHDPIDTGWSAVRSWPRLVHIFGAQRPSVERVVLDGEQVATVQGISYPRRDVQENLSLLFEKPVGPGPHIGVLHCNVSGAGLGTHAGRPAGSAGWSAHADYSPCSLADLTSRGLDYWALGHVHTRCVLAGGAGEPFVVYPGNTQGRSPAAPERGAKGAMVVHADGSQILDVEFVPCDAVRFADVEIDLADAADLPDVGDLLRQGALLALEEADGRSLMLPRAPHRKVSAPR